MKRTVREVLSSITEEQRASIRRVSPAVADRLNANTPIPTGEEESRQFRGVFLDSLRSLTSRAAEEKRNLDDHESRAFDSILAVADVLGDAIEERRLAGRVNGASQRTLTDTPRFFDGVREVRALRHSDRVADAVPSVALPDGLRADELSLGRAVRALVRGNWQGAEAERRVMGEAFDTGGGFTMPTPLSLPVVDILRNQTRVSQAGALTVPTDRPEIIFAVLETDGTAQWKAENAAITASDSTFGMGINKVRTLVGMFKGSVELFEDAPNVASLLERALGETLGLALDLGTLRGDGTANTLTGVRNTTGIQTIDLGTNGATLIGYDAFSRAYTKIQNVNGPTEGINIIYAPRTAGDIDLMKDGDGLPLRGPESWGKMGKFITNQVPVTNTKGTATTASEAYVADWSQLIIGMRTTLTVEISRQAADSSGSAFGNLQVWVRAYLRAACVVQRPNQFVLIDGILAS